MTLVFLSSLICFATLLKLKRDPVEPAFLLVIVWGLISGMEIYWGVYSISLYAQIIISASIAFFCMSSALISSRIFSSNKIYPNYINSNIGMYLSLFLVIFFPVFVNGLNGLSELSNTTAIELRDAMTESNHNKDLSPIISIGLNFPIVFLIYYTSVVSKVRDKWLFCLFFVGLLYILLSFSKGYLLQFVIPPLINLYIRGLITKKHLSVIFCILLSVIILLFFVRDYFVGSSVLFQMYILAPVAAFDQIVLGKFSLNSPEYDFLTPFYDFFNLAIDRSRDTHWVDVGVPTNVFTVFGILTNDFGGFGCVIIFSLLGVLSRVIYIKARNNQNVILLTLLGWVIYGVGLSFFSDGLLGMIGTYSKYLLLIYFIDCFFSKRIKIS
ncbi:O-antigen polymerase [Chromobacterium paludis]|nr:O-antigen polymerase [Chromobacterium paludis]